MGILDDHALCSGQPKELRAAQVGVGGGLARDTLGVGDEAVDHDGEVVCDACGVQHDRRVAGAGDDGYEEPGIDYSVEKSSRTVVGAHAVLFKHLGEGGVLAVAETADRLELRRVGDLALGQFDSAGCEQ